MFDVNFFQKKTHLVVSPVIRQSFRILFGEVETVLDKKFERTRLDDVVFGAQDHDVEGLDLIT